MEDSRLIRWLKRGLVIVVLAAVVTALFFREMSTVAILIAVPASVALFVPGWLTNDDDMLT
jgi:hypothetical protein